MTVCIGLGTGALFTPFRDPDVMAKEIATIDFIGGGRLLPVFGVNHVCLASIVCQQARQASNDPSEIAG